MVALRRALQEADRIPVHLLQAEAVQEQMRQIRRDALPEHTHYADTGCDLHPRCLTCPLERCRYDEAGGLRGLESAARDREVLALHQAGGNSVTVIARRVGVSRRTVFRILARHRQEGGARHGDSGLD